VDIPLPSSATYPELEIIISFKKSSEELLWKNFPALGTFVTNLGTSDTTDTQTSTCEVAGVTGTNNEYGLPTI
jgi:hypothetical protein